MTWQWIAFNLALIALVCYLLLIVNRVTDELHRDRRREAFYRSYADELLGQSRREYERRLEVDRQLLAVRRDHADTAGRLMELQTLVDGAVGDGSYPPDAHAWLEICEATLHGERSPMFGNVRPLRPSINGR